MRRSILTLSAAVLLSLGAFPGTGIAQVVDLDFDFDPGDDVILYAMSREGELVAVPGFRFVTDWWRYEELLAAGDTQGIDQLRKGGHLTPLASGTRAKVIKRVEGSTITDTPTRDTYEVRVAGGPRQGQSFHVLYACLRPSITIYGPGIVADADPEKHGKAILASDRLLFEELAKAGALAQVKAQKLPKRLRRRKGTFGKDVLVAIKATSEKYDREPIEVLYIINSGIAAGWTEQAIAKVKEATPDSGAQDAKRKGQAGTKLKLAQSLEKAKNVKAALQYYREIARDFADLPEGKTASERIKALDGK